MKYLIFTILLCITHCLVAQDFQGIATYKSQRKLDIKLDSSQINSEMQEQIKAMMKKQFEKTYLLSFSKEKSLYKEEKSLEAPQISGVRVVVADTGGSDILYKNVKENKFTNQNEVLGKVFLIKDKLKKLDWTLGSETKNIGDYTCYKATMVIEREARRQIRRGGGLASNNDTKEAEVRMEKVTVTAWYTTEIPVNNGPGKYQGLPGLILEVDDGSESLLCSKIVINPKNKINIKEPTKGQLVSQKKYDEIMRKKRKEMLERQGTRGNGQGLRIIRNGG